MADKPVTFFIDRCLTGHRFRNALRRAGLTVESLEDHLPQDVQDACWIPLISSPPFEWVIVTKDRAILTNPVEFDAICDSRARVVMFADQDLSAQDMIDQFLHHKADIQNTVETRDAPLIIVLHADRIEVHP